MPLCPSIDDGRVSQVSSGDVGQVIDVYVSPRRNLAAARKFFTTAIAAHGEPEEVVTERPPRWRT
jgi:transposase-like protein